jgi:serine/threonine protein kinase
MDKFQIIKSIGDGTYGTVVEALNKQTKEIVAIKKMKKKFATWDECMSLREIKHLRKLNHVNVVKLKEVIRVANELYLIFEYVKGTVLDLIREGQK